MRKRGGKTKAINISGIDGNTLHKAIHDNVSHGSTIYTDELQGYGGMAALPTKTSGVIIAQKSMSMACRERVGGYETRL